MRIIHAEFYGLKYLLTGVAKIRHLTITLASRAQIIIGTNGSGKSRLMHELTVLPAKRPDYISDGYKKITAVDTDGTEYLITSDFTKKSSPHSIYRLSDNTELNPGGTEDAQDDIISTLFGIDRKKSDLLCHRTAISEMTASTRKEWLVSMNPVSLGFIFEKHRYVLSQIKACKNQLTLLIDRKATLEADMLDAALCEQLTSESNVLTTEIAKLVEFQHRLGERLTLHQTSQSIDINNVTKQIASFLETIRGIRHRHMMYGDIDRHTDATIQLRQYENSNAALCAAMSELEKQAHVLANDVDRYNCTLEKLFDNRSLTDINETIEAITRQLADIQTIEDPGWSIHAINDAPEVLRQFRDICVRFSALGGILYPRITYDRKRQAIYRQQSRLTHIVRELEQLDTDIETLLKSKKAYHQPIPEPCAKAQCPLYLQFSTRQSNIQTELTAKKLRQNKLQHTQARITKYIAEQTERLATTTAHSQDLKNLTTLLNMPQNGHIRQALFGVDIIQRLQTNPSSLLMILEETYSAALNTQIRKNLTQDLDKHIQQQEQVRAVGTVERDALLSVLAEKKTALTLIRERIDAIEKQRSILTQKINQHTSYLADLETLTRLGKEIDGLFKGCQAGHDYQQLQHIRRTLSDYQQNTVRRLSSIERTLREQHILQERYTQEVLGQITAVESKKHNLQLLESALADIPQIYMVRFLNSILHTANQLIKEVFSYPLAFQLRVEDRPLDYKLPIRNSGETVPDVSDCSTAQKAMLNFAFNAATIIHLDLTNCPIWLDEIGEGFDQYHEQKLIQLLGRMANAKQFSQLFLVNHHAIIHGGFSNADVLVLDDSNVLTPSKYNTHAKIEKEI